MQTPQRLDSFPSLCGKHHFNICCKIIVICLYQMRKKENTNFEDGFPKGVQGRLNHFTSVCKIYLELHISGYTLFYHYVFVSNNQNCVQNLLPMLFTYLTYKYSA
ncbi:hypothetical protein EGR_11104 [Echinococcus granulosus]|uniref:Uncharacterized protein n=1 Tax=Echinococcus granulosus TaxID=6210 RepID=W6TZ87_ECHGR|nr:hypothetical protein EGR_11104 [Echinococcus granulosus]EUB54038.1 hypothetical protein EGR_11104 [Echinococcus granulosus]